MALCGTSFPSFNKTKPLIMIKRFTVCFTILQFLSWPQKTYHMNCLKVQVIQYTCKYRYTYKLWLRRYLNSYVVCQKNWSIIWPKHGDRKCICFLFLEVPVIRLYFKHWNISWKWLSKRTTIKQLFRDLKHITPGGKGLGMMTLF